jgi:Zn-dependent peptidase ImmA (M78 family)/transcriptional regulator with XRE-family HTH domain
MATVSEVGTRVRAERNRLGLSERALAMRAGLSQPRIHRIETDPGRPIDLVDLSKIAAGLGVTMTGLLEDSPVRDRILAATRARNGSAAMEASRTACDLIELEERLSGFGVGDRQRLRLPLVQYPTSNPDEQGRYLAETVRASWGIPEAPLGDLAELIEDFTGADVAICDLPAEVSGLTVTEQTAGIAVVLASTGVGPQHQRFTLAHELGHLLSGDTRIDTTHMSSDSQSERRANSFAGHLLMPAAGIRRWLDASGNPAVGTERVVAALAHAFGVSLEVALIQLRKIGLIGNAQKQALSGAGARTLAFRYGWLAAWQAAAEAAKIPRPPRRLWLRALSAYQSGKLGVIALARLNGVDPNRLRAELDSAGVLVAPPAPAPIDFDALVATAAN